MWVTSFGNGLKIGSMSGPVDVRLISFTGSREENISKLEWTTANEETGERYELERSIDGMHFEKIASMNSNTLNNNRYQYQDHVAGNMLYYRINVRTAAGSSFYSNVVLLKTITPNSSDVQLVQNPVTNTIHLRVTMPEAAQLSVVLNDLSGKMILRKTISVNENIMDVKIPVPNNCRNGMYVLRFEAPGLKKNMRVMINR